MKFVVSSVILFGFVVTARGAEMTPEALLSQNRDLRVGGGAVVHRNSDGTCLVLGVGAGDIGVAKEGAEEDAHRQAKLRMVEAMRGTNVKVASSLTENMKSSVKNGVETASMETTLKESSSFVTSGTVSRVQSLSSWKSDDGDRIFVAVYQRNDAVYLPTADRLRGALAKGTSFADFLPNELKAVRGEYPTGDFRRKEILESVAGEIYAGIVSTLSKQSGYVLTEDKDQAALVLGVETDSLRVTNSGSGKSRELSLSLTGEVKISNSGMGEVFFNDRFSGKSKKVKYESPKGFEEAFQEVRRDLLSEVQASVRMARCRLLLKMKLAKIVLGKNGKWFFGLGVDSGVLAPGDEISISKPSASGEVKVAQGKVENVDDVIHLLNVSGLEAGEYVFHLESAAKLKFD